MHLTIDQVRAMAAAINLKVPDDELAGVAIRLSCLLTAMEQIESKLGAQLDAVDPVPPIWPNQ